MMIITLRKYDETGKNMAFNCVAQRAPISAIMHGKKGLPWTHQAQIAERHLDVTEG